MRPQLSLCFLTLLSFSPFCTDSAALIVRVSRDVTSRHGDMCEKLVTLGYHNDENTGFQQETTLGTISERLTTICDTQSDAMVSEPSPASAGRIVFTDLERVYALCRSLDCTKFTTVIVVALHNSHHVTKLSDHVTQLSDHVSSRAEESGAMRKDLYPPRSFNERYNSIKQVVKYLILVLVTEGPARVRDLTFMFIRHGRLDILPREMSRDMPREVSRRNTVSGEEASYIATYNIDVWCCVFVILAILVGTTVYLTVIIILHVVEKSRARLYR